jgi:hypothetical protein
MDIREHSVALISVIVGLGLTVLLGNLNRLIRARRQVRWDALPLLWALIALLLVNNYWWGLYQGSVVATAASSAATFLVGLSMPIMLYLICAAALPNVRSSGSCDMRAAYLAESRYFFALILLYVLATLAQTLVALGAFRWSEAMVQRCLLMAVIAPMIWKRSIGYHWFATGAMLLILVYRLMQQELH